MTAQSHQVITNLLDEICAAADEEGVGFRGVQIKRGRGCADARFRIEESSGRAQQAAANAEFRVIAGTTWVWAREDMRDSVDVLVVDEAGQFSLADTLASAPRPGAWSCSATRASSIR